MRPYSIFILFVLVALLIPPASAEAGVSVSLSDLNLVSRNIELYAVDGTNITLIYTGASDNSTFTLNPALSYQIIAKPSRFSWIDDPRDLLNYLINTASGQTISFLVLFVVIIGPLRWIFK